MGGSNSRVCRACWRAVQCADVRAMQHRSRMCIVHGMHHPHLHPVDEQRVACRVVDVGGHSHHVPATVVQVCTCKGAGTGSSRLG